MEKRPLTVKFSKFCSESFHRLTGRRCCVFVLKFREMLPTGNKRNRALFTVVCISNARYCVDCFKICQGQPPGMYSEYSRFHPNLFMFGWVIAERMKTAKLPRKVNLIFGRSLALSRIRIDVNKWLLLSIASTLKEWGIKKSARTMWIVFLLN